MHSKGREGWGKEWWIMGMFHHDQASSTKLQIKMIGSKQMIEIQPKHWAVMLFIPQFLWPGLKNQMQPGLVTFPYVFYLYKTGLCFAKSRSLEFLPFFGAGSNSWVSNLCQKQSEKHSFCEKSKNSNPRRFLRHACPELHTTRFTDKQWKQVILCRGSSWIRLHLR